MHIPTIETRRLILRERTEEVLEWAFANLEGTELRSFLGVLTEADWKRESLRFEGGQTTWSISFLMWDLLEKSSGKVIGLAGFHQWYKEHQRAEIGYRLNHISYHGKGLMTEALLRVYTYGFEDMNLNRIEALIAPDNEPSLKLAAKFGFKQEARLRRHWNHESEIQDTLQFALLREEYKPPPIR